MGGASGLTLFQFSHLSARLSAAPADEGKEKKEGETEEAKEDGKEAASANASDAAAANASSANTTNDSANATSNEATVSATDCVTRKDERAHAWFAETAPPGSPCLFGVDVRDEGSHCIFEEGIYGSNGFCYTAADKSAWGSCNENCPLYGQGAQLGKKIDSVAKVMKTVKKKLLGSGDEEDSNTEEDSKKEAKTEAKEKAGAAEK